MSACDPKPPFEKRAKRLVKCPSCKAKITASDFTNDPWSKVDKHGEGFYECPSCGRKLVHRWAFGASFLLFVFVGAAVVGLLSEALALGVLWLIGMFAIPGEAVSEAVTFSSYVSVAGFVCIYAVRLVEVESR